MAKLTRKFNGKVYHRTGTYFTSKRTANREAASWRKNGHLARVILAPVSSEYPRSLKRYQVWATL